MMFSGVFKRQGQGQEGGRTKQVAWIAFLLLASVSILSLYVFNNSFLDLIKGIVAYREFRASNSIVYYAYGLLGFTGFLCLSYVIEKVAPHYITLFLSSVGQFTFFLFLWGNAILLIIPQRDYSGATVLFMICAVMIISISITYFWGKTLRKTKVLLFVNTKMENVFKMFYLICGFQRHEQPKQKI